MLQERFARHPHAPTEGLAGPAIIEVSHDVAEVEDQGRSLHGRYAFNSTVAPLTRKADVMNPWAGTSTCTRSLRRPASSSTAWPTNLDSRAFPPACTPTTSTFPTCSHP